MVFIFITFLTLYFSILIIIIFLLLLPFITLSTIDVFFSDFPVVANHLLPLQHWILSFWCSKIMWIKSFWVPFIRSHFHKTTHLSHWLPACKNVCGARTF